MWSTATSHSTPGDEFAARVEARGEDRAVVREQLPLVALGEIGCRANRLGAHARRVHREDHVALRTEILDHVGPDASACG